MRLVGLELPAAETARADLVVPRERRAVRQFGHAGIDVGGADAGQRHREEDRVRDDPWRRGVGRERRRLDGERHEQLVDLGCRAVGERFRAAEIFPDPLGQPIRVGTRRLGLQGRLKGRRRQRDHILTGRRSAKQHHAGRHTRSRVSCQLLLWLCRCYFFFAGGHARTKLPRFGICTFGKVFASITASAAITPLRCSRYAVNAYASALVSECGAG